ncbi:membrane-associated protein, putative, partial [Bodo saltans]
MNAKPRRLRDAVQPVFLATACFVLISSFPLAVVASECASPTPTSSSLSVASCSVSTADLVVDVGQLGVGVAGSTRTVSVTNIDLAGHALIIAGWLASNPVDIARVDTHSMTISVTGVRGFGRLIVSGNFPNLTTFTIASTSIALNTSIAASVASATYGCSSATTISSAMCVVAPSLTYPLSIGSDVTLTNTWDPIVGHSTYSGSVAVASAITFVVGNVGISGTVAVTNSLLGTILSPGDVSLSAAGFWIQTTNNMIAGTVLLLNTSIHVAVSSAPGVLAQGVTWGGALWDVAADTLFIGGNGAWNVTRCALDVQTSLVAATNAVGVYIRGVLSLYGTAQFMIDQTSVHVLTDHDEDSGVAEGVHFGFVRLTRGSMVTFMDSTWNVTSLVGNATMLYVPINGRFPSLFLLYRNKVHVNAPTANTTASFMITYGVMTMESQMLIHSNTIEVLTNATDSITIAPVGVRVSSMEATIDPVVTSQLLYGGTLDDGMFNISIGGSFSLVDSNFTFGDALLPIAVDGPLDIIFNLYPGCFMQLQGLRLTGGPGVVLLSRSFVKVFPTEVNGYSFALGCLGVNDDYPANILSQYMYNDVLDVITAVPYCDCATSASALGTATTISGVYPNCVFTCQRASSNPISLLRERCAAPTFFSVSATITTKTMPPVQTATTYTDFISETKRSLTLSNSTTLPHTTSPIPSKSLSVPLTPTVKLTPSPTLIASPSRTKT